MANYKFVSINVSEDEEEAVVSQYGKMGFELIKSIHTTNKNEHGTVTSTHYNCNFKFDRDQKNADKLWAIYKDYTKKRESLRYLHSDALGETLIRVKTFFTLTLILTVILTPFASGIVGNGIFDFSSSSIFASSSDFDLITFILSASIGLAGGLLIAPFALFIQSAATRSKRMMLADDKILETEKEIDNLVNKAAELRK